MLELILYFCAGSAGYKGKTLKSVLMWAVPWAVAAAFVMAFLIRGRYAPFEENLFVFVFTASVNSLLFFAFFKLGGFLGKRKAAKVAA